MTHKKTAIAVALVMMAMTFAPVASANPENLARTFLDNHPAVYVEWKDPAGGGQGGVGWYDPFTPGNLCLVSLFGLRIGAGATYYDTMRMTTNFNKHVFELGQDILVDLPCPFAVTSPPDQNKVGTSKFNVDVTQKARFSGLLCINNPIAECVVQPGTEDWDLFACKAEADSGAEVVPGLVTDKPLPVSFAPGDLLFELTGLVALDGATAIGSSAIFCNLEDTDPTMPVPNEVTRDFGHWHDATATLNPVTRLACDFSDCPHIDQIVHVGHGDAYVRSDYEAMGVDLNLDKKGGEPFAVCVHDYFLVLDRASPDQWLLDIEDHLRGDPFPPNVPPNMPPLPGEIQLLRGVFDLSSNNGCVADVNCPLEPKMKGDPLPPKPDKYEEGDEFDCTTESTKKDNPDPKDP